MGLFGSDSESEDGALLGAAKPAPPAAKKPAGGLFGSGYDDPPGAAGSLLVAIEAPAELRVWVSWFACIFAVIEEG